MTALPPLLAPVVSVVYEVVKAVWDFLVDAIYVVVLMVYGVVYFAIGLVTAPMETIRTAATGATWLVKEVADMMHSYWRALKLLYLKLTHGMPPAVRVLILVFALAAVMMASNYAATLSRKRNRDLVAARMTSDAMSLDAYKGRIADDINAAPLPPTKAPASSKRWWNPFTALRDAVFGAPAAGPNYVAGRKANAPKWRYDPESNQWRWQPAAAQHSTAADSNSGGESLLATEAPSTYDTEGGYQGKRQSPYSDYYDSTPRRDGGRAGNDASPAAADTNWESNYDPKPARRRNRLSDDELDDTLDRNTKADADEVAQLQQRIEYLKARDRVAEVRIAVEELRQRRKLRDQMQNEYEWADELEARRELKRERERLKWRAEDLRWRRQYRAIAETDDRGDATDDGARRGQGTLDEIDDVAGNAASTPRRCGPPVTVPTYPEFVSKVTQSDYAYVTYVSSSEYVQGAAVLMYSIALTGSQYARAIAVTSDIGKRDRELLSKLAQVIEIERVSHPHHISNAHYVDTFSKLRIWELAMYKKVVYIDVDVIVLRNLDDLFDLSEWSVPMDAEQSRYSTGMMVCEPRLSTFDDMIKKLQTTTVSMELPDLLFLKEYFDNTQRSPAAPTNAWSRGAVKKSINIIPRWYQVYQEEFGSQYSTYLTGRKQKITIYDRRIHGLHYPGNNKPWHFFSGNWAKYAPHFCRWRNNEQFIYDPKFLWYVHFSWLKTFLKSTVQEVGFEFESGGTVIKLTEWSAAERKKYSSWDSPPSYDNDNDDTYKRGTRLAGPTTNYKTAYDGQYGRHGTVTTAPTPKPTVSYSDSDWVPSECSIRRKIITAAQPTNRDAHQASASRTAGLVPLRSRTRLVIETVAAKVTTATTTDAPAATTTLPPLQPGRETVPRTTAAAPDAPSTPAQGGVRATPTALPAAEGANQKSTKAPPVQSTGAALHTGSALLPTPTTSAAAAVPIRNQQLAVDGKPPTSSAAASTPSPSTVHADGATAIPTQAPSTAAAAGDRHLQGLFSSIPDDDDESSSGGGPAAPVTTRPPTFIMRPSMVGRLRGTGAAAKATSADDDIDDPEGLTGAPQATEADAGAKLSAVDTTNPVVVDLGTLLPVALRLPQQWAGVALEPYIWVISWCSTRKIRPAAQSACGKSAYVSQYSGGFCRANFAEAFSLHLILSPPPASTTKAGQEQEVMGVVLRSAVSLTMPPRRKLMEVVVRCDWTMDSETEARVDTAAPNGTRVTVSTSRAPNDRLYTIRLRSRCACAGGCGAAKAIAPVDSRPAAPPKAEVRAWAAKTFGSAVSPFPRRSAFRECFGSPVANCLALPGCDYMVQTARCQPAVSLAWVPYRKAAEGFYSNCTHIGGNAVEVVTLEQCQALAVQFGANVVNFGAWPKGAVPVPDTPPPKGKVRKIDSGCYYKRCPAVKLFQGVPDIKRALAKDESGFDVYFANPFFLSEQQAAAFEKFKQKGR